MARPKPHRFAISGVIQGHDVTEVVVSNSHLIALCRFELKYPGVTIMSSIDLDAPPVQRELPLEY